MYLLYSTKTQKTGRILRRVLGIEGGIAAPTHVHDVLIRWGSSAPVRYTPELEINSRVAVEAATDKVGSLQILKRKAISVPELFLFNEGMKNLSKHFPLLARNRIHQQGTDILLCMQMEDVKRAMNLGREYGVKYVPTKREYRVHIFKGKSIKASEKIWTDQNRQTYKPWIRNHRNGYTFRQPITKLDDLSRATAKKAVKALGLDFGAVDLIISDNDKVFVLEVNTGPGLIKSGVKKYTTHLAKTLGITINQRILDAIEDPNEEN